MPSGRHIVRHDNQRLRPWRDAVAWYARQAAADTSLLRGPVAVEAIFRFQRPKSHFGRRGLLPSAPADHIVRPDPDRLCRAIGDALSEAGTWRDDSQMVCLVGWKLYADQPGVMVTVEEVEEAPGWRVLQQVR